jgi:type I restriction enzyme, S subunit
MSWPLVRLGDVCTVIPGFAFKSQSFSADGIPLVKIASIKDNGSVDFSDAQYWPRELFTEKLSKYVLAYGDIVLAMTGATAGKIGRIRTSEPLLLNQRVAKIQAVTIDPDFLWCALSSEIYRERFFGIAGGAAQPNMSGGQIEAVVVPCPSRPVQETIAAIISAYDDLIENNRRRMALLEDSARLLYNEWFVRLRFPGYEHTRIVDGVPDGWERVPLENALVLQRGFDLPTQARQDGTVPIYGSTGILGYHDKAKASAPGVVTGRSGTLGEVQYVADDYWPLNTALWVKEFKRVTPLFALFLLRKMDLRQYNGGASVPTLDRKSVHRIEILIPSNLLLHSFDEFAVDVFAQIKNLNAQNQKLRAARDLLLPRLMSGEIAV